MKHPSILGIDIGGTSIKSGIVRDGKLLHINETKTSPENTGSMLESIFTVIDNALKFKINGIGIGIPGFMNEKTGVIEMINNIPALRGFNLSEKIKGKFNIRVKINNDANCFALGEYHFGNYNTMDNVIGITLGTGVGGGIIMNKKLYSGLCGGAGEFGCIPYQGEIFEYFCSNNFFKIFYNQNAHDLYNKARLGNEIALSGFYNFGLHLGNLINHILYFLAPEAIIIGGKISKAFNFFYPGVVSSLNNYPVDFIRKELKISQAIVEEPGIVGAASLWLHEIKSEG